MDNKNNVTLPDEIRVLWNILEQTIKEQVGEGFFNKLVEIRKLSESARQEEKSDDDIKLKWLIRELSSGELKNLTRAFGLFLNLANTAESNYSMKSLRQFDTDPLSKHFTELTTLIPRLLDAGKSKHEIRDAIANMSIELVLTAHPTEVKRRTQLQKYGRISNILDELSHTDLTAYERKEKQEELFMLITALWSSDEIRRVKPTPIEEARWGMAIVEDILWEAVPKFIRELDSIMTHYTGDKLDNYIAPIKIASWMGGDRDGNPNVTHDVTEHILLMNRWMAAVLYHKTIDDLIQTVSSTDCSEELRAIVGDVHEPYRALLRPFRNRFQATKKWAEAKLEGRHYDPSDRLIDDVEELKEAIELCHRSMSETYGQHLADCFFLDVLRQIACFGLNLIKLDIRQESTRHSDVLNFITEYLELGSYNQWTEKEKQAFLVTELNSKRPLISPQIPFDEEAQEVLDTFITLRKKQVDCFGAYVISMSHAPSDVLAVHLLQKECGIRNHLRVVPLFETLDDLNNSGQIMARLFSIDWYRNICQGKQEVMIGYSDSGKDAGKLAASWAQYEAQENIARVCFENKIELTLFHGRGGSIGRGGGPVEHALLSQPPQTVEGKMRVTEQGEVITQKFSSMDLAMHNLMLYVTAVLEATLLPPPEPKPQWRDLMQEMSEISCTAYRDIIRGRDNFVKYFRQVTPEQELGRLCIGSRPAKRKKDGGIDSLRAIPWMFAWTQTRLMMPTWLGISDALMNAIEKGKKDVLQDMIKNWPFFYFLMDMLDMVLTKTDPRIAAYYDELLASDDVARLGVEIRGKLNQTIAVANEVVTGLGLDQERKQLRASIKFRNPYADTLNYFQGEIMRRIYKESQNQDPVLEDALMVTIAAIAAAMKNTG